MLKQILSNVFAMYMLAALVLIGFAFAAQYIELLGMLVVNIVQAITGNCGA